MKYKLFIAGTVLFGLLFYAKTEADEERQFWKELSTVEVKMTGKPPLGQESIDLAMVAFGIEIPPGNKYPKYDPNEENRGMLMKGTVGDSTVTIGPAAFTSWAVLGSTLAHELEVHGKQHLAPVLFAGLFGFGDEVSSFYEREAYDYEVRNSKRFGLTTSEAAGIFLTKMLIYGE